MLNDVLVHLRGVNPRTPLGTLVQNSEHALPWRNYALIVKIVEDRNALAHRAKIIRRRNCWRYIGAIEKELVQWGIVDAPP